MEASTDATDALVLLASRFEQQGQPLQAIHCLQALLRTRLLPDQEARARLSVGRLMLEHTRNTQDAGKELQRAQQLAANLMGSHALKCEIACQLGQYFKMLAEVPYQVQAYQNALQACEAGISSAERPTLLRWMGHIHMRLAEAYLSQSDVARALQAAETGARAAAQHGLKDIQLVCVLQSMQLALAQCDFTAFNAHIGVGSKLIAEVEVLQRQPGSQIAPGFVSYAIMHFSMLQVLADIGHGHVFKLSPTEDPVADTAPQNQSFAMVNSMLAMLTQSESEGRSGYTWLDPNITRALLGLISATLYLHSVKSRLADEQLAQCDVHLKSHLASLGLEADSSNEAALDTKAMWDVRLPLVLRVSTQCCMAVSALTQSALPEARTAILQAISQVMRFPNVLAGMFGPVHAVLGQYATAMGDTEAAAAHFQRARDISPDSQSTAFASALLALLYLSEEADESGAHKAIGALGDLYTKLTTPGYKSQDESLEGVSVEMAVALIKLRLEQTQDAKLRLRRMLKTTHKKLHHHGLVVQVMLNLVPLLLASGDLRGAEQLITSAGPLRPTHSATGLVQLQATRVVVARAKGNAGDVQQAEVALNKGITALNTLVSKVRQQDLSAHTTLMGWDLGA